MEKLVSTNLVLTLLTAAFLQGCATALLSSAPVTSTVVKQEDIAQDIVRAIGYPTKNGEKIDGLILLGDKFTYWLTDGHKKIELMAGQLNPSFINMENVTTIEAKDNKFSGKFNFVYDRDNDDYSQSEIGALKNLCNKETVPGGKWLGFGKHDNYRCWIYVSGQLYSRRTSELLAVTNLSKGHSLRLVSKGESITEVDQKKVVDKLFALPFAIAFDLTTLPIQVIFLLGRNK